MKKMVIPVVIIIICGFSLGCFDENTDNDTWYNNPKSYSPIDVFFIRNISKDIVFSISNEMNAVSSDYCYNEDLTVRWCKFFPKKESNTDYDERQYIGSLKQHNQIYDAKITEQYSQAGFTLEEELTEDEAKMLFGSLNLSCGFPDVYDGKIRNVETHIQTKDFDKTVKEIEEHPMISEYYDTTEKVG